MKTASEVHCAGRAKRRSGKEPYEEEKLHEPFSADIKDPGKDFTTPGEK
jgi:hypothetical protein